MENVEENVEENVVEKKDRKKTLKVILISIFAVLVIGILTFLLVFHVREIEVIGNTRYTENEIKSMALTKVYSSNSFLVTWLDGNQEVTDIPFINGFKIEKVSNSKLRIIVSQKQIIGYIKDGERDAFFDKDGLVVEIVEVSEPEIVDGKQVIVGEAVDDKELIKPEELGETADETRFHAAVTNVPLIEGLEVGTIALNRTLKVKDQSVFNTIWGITRMVEKFDIQPDRVFFAEDGSATMYYGDIRVLIGDSSLIEEKIARAAAILPKLTGEVGELHLDDYKTGVDTIVFTKDVVASESDDEASDEDDGDSDGEEAEETAGYEETSEEYEE